MKIYFVRHGESEANILREFSNGLNKHGLTETGRAQAQALAQALLGKGISRIYSSPILRAVQTAEILAHALGCPSEIAAALREYDVGVLEGTQDPAGHALFWQVTEAWLKRGELDRRISGGESFLDIRALPAVSGWAAGEAAGPGRRYRAGRARRHLPLHAAAGAE